MPLLIATRTYANVYFHFPIVENAPSIAQHELIYGASRPRAPIINHRDAFQGLGIHQHYVSAVVADRQHQS